MLKAQWMPYDLDFTFEAVTSRERMWRKRTYFVRICDTDNPDIAGVGECALFRGLSTDDVPDYEARLAHLCAQPDRWCECGMPSLRFGFETAIADLRGGGRRIWTESDWVEGRSGIVINGLIWMGDRRTMAERIAEKLDQGFRVLKLKIGGINFDEECSLLEAVRRRFSSTDLEIRLDANGSFSKDKALERLERLARFDIHSIEQPLKAGQPDATAELCRRSPIDIALDEELIGYRTEAEAADLLDRIRPQYIILKPALIGGTGAADTYVSLAESMGMGWWATSALESNIGLNAIAQWVATKKTSMPQGLGTGRLYNNNVSSPLEVRGDRLFHNPSPGWGEIESGTWRD